MKLEQHFYTSGKTEFTTVAATEGISREERIKLENHSIYFLPVSLHYQENITTPVKYIWYPLNEERFVVGKAIYKGKDSLGRTGNYLFHNIIVSKQDLMTSSRFNPVKLIIWLEEQQVFKTEVPVHSVRGLELDVPQTSPFAISPKNANGDVCGTPQRDLLLQILYICVFHEFVHQPLLLIGTEKECLEFLEWLYIILPYHIREEICVDTYAYGVSLGFQIIGSLEEQEFRQGLTSSLTLHLANLQHTSYLDMPEISRHLAFITDMAASQRMKALNDVYSLEYCLKQDNYTRFKQEYRVLSPELQDVIWGFHEGTLLKHIVAELDTELLLMVQDKLSVEDITILYAAPEMINQLVETGNSKNLELIAHWMCTEGDNTRFYPFLFKSPSLWEVFLERIRSHPQEAEFLLDPARAFQAYYSPEFEKTLLEKTLTFLPYVKKERKLTKEFFKALDALPQMGAAQMDSTSEQPPMGTTSKEASILPSQAHEISDGHHVQSGAHLYLLRTFIKYELSKDSDILEHLIDSDCSVLTEEQQTMVFDSIVDKVLIIKSLKIWNPDKAEQQVRRLFKHALKSNTLLLRLFASMEKLELASEVRKMLEEVFTELFPKDETSPQIQSMIAQVLKPPASLFERITEKLFSLRDL